MFTVAAIWYYWPNYSPEIIHYSYLDTPEKAQQMRHKFWCATQHSRSPLNFEISANQWKSKRTGKSENSQHARGSIAYDCITITVPCNLHNSTYSSQGSRKRARITRQNCTRFMCECIMWMKYEESLREPNVWCDSLGIKNQWVWCVYFCSAWSLD